jgi:hypothetical protein
MILQALERVKLKLPVTGAKEESGPVRYMLPVGQGWGSHPADL